MYDIFFVSEDTKQYQKLKSKFPTTRQVANFYDAQKLAITKMFWVVWPDLSVDKDFNFLYDVPIWDQKYIHIFKNKNTFNGITLFPKRCNVTEDELKTRIFLEKKEIDIVASNPFEYDMFEIDSYD
jgi:hypothetical protein